MLFHLSVRADQLPDSRDQRLPSWVLLSHLLISTAQRSGRSAAGEAGRLQRLVRGTFAVWVPITAMRLLKPLQPLERPLKIALSLRYLLRYCDDSDQPKNGKDNARTA